MKEIHSSFGDWYRAAKVAPDGDILKKRWAGVHAFSPDRAQVVELTRTFYRIGRQTDQFMTDFRGAFQKDDPAFSAKGNEMELAVLAGAALVDSWCSYGEPDGSYAALAVICASCRDLRKPVVPGIVELAVQEFGERCVDRFQSPDAKPADLGQKAQQQVQAHCDSGATPNLGAPFISLMQEVARLRHQVELNAEETNILWWMLGEHSRDSGQHLADLEPGAACLTVGKDLADLVRKPPGPLAALAFLDRALGLTKAKPDVRIRLKDAVQAVPPPQREKWLASSRWDDVLGDICPLSLALRLSLTATKKDSWLPAFEERTGISKNTALAARELAHQIYLEGVLHQLWRIVE